MAEYLEKLNDAQRVATEYPGDLPLLVIAGAGTGKTMTLAHRVAHLVKQGANPDRILLLTFTRRAADEMSRRVEAIVREADAGRKVTLPWAGTFHSVANRLLRRFAANLQLDPGFSVLDRGDAADLIDVVRHENGLSKQKKRFPRKDTCLAIYSRCMNTRTPLPDVLNEYYPWALEWEDELKALFRRYVERKQANQSLDYDDLLAYWEQLVSDTDFASDISSWFDHVLVDEYQDTNVVQDTILLAIKPTGQGVTVVGDDAQSIYSFRAACVDNILAFPGRFKPAAEVVALEQNYRSTQAILDSANCLIGAGARQYRKQLFSDKGEGMRPRYLTVEDSDAEADHVVESVLEHRERGLLLKQQAVLFRSSHHSDRLEIELVRRNIPYVKYGGLKFLEAAHVKDMLAVLKWAENPKNEVAAFRVLKLLPGIGPRLADKCIAHLKLNDHNFSSFSGMSVTARGEWTVFCELMKQLSNWNREDNHWQPQIASVRRWYQPQLERIYDSIETRAADLEQLEQIAGRYASRERFLTELTLDPPSVSGDQSNDAHRDEDYLVLSTVHSAKGQEWDAVYILNVTDGNFPNEFATGKPEAIEEERRLLYVAMTRAKQSLSLVSPLRFHVTQQDRRGDVHVYGARSRFVTDELMDTFDCRFAGKDDGIRPGLRPGSDKCIPAAETMRNMW